jgi:hypothetical protein
LSAIPKTLLQVMITGLSETHMEVPGVKAAFTEFHLASQVLTEEYKPIAKLVLLTLIKTLLPRKLLLNFTLMTNL